MHKKETAISPILQKELGIEIIIPNEFNTDAFGTFTNEVERDGDQLHAARRKIEKGMAQTGLQIGISSEGSFGPHPMVPFLPFNRELVLFVDKALDLEITGFIANSKTNYKQAMIESFDEAYGFADSIGFPDHGVILKTTSSTTNSSEIIKGITDIEQLKTAINSLFRKSPKSLYIETDMRAMYNPTRMKNIELATLDLVNKIKTTCPNCSMPGYEVVKANKGLKCEYCSCPTDLILSHIYFCKKCEYKEEKMYPNGNKTADPSRCPLCNP
ncbi:hypothetical protein H1D32_09965 [Anaerobacillus sp. CMMVII]|nr:hypothetical protein [Anaerobacillus sp. CMMVII]